MSVLDASTRREGDSLAIHSRHRFANDLVNLTSGVRRIPKISLVQVIASSSGEHIRQAWYGQVRQTILFGVATNIILKCLEIKFGNKPKKSYNIDKYSLVP
jgi:hypothetical protein